MNMNSQKWNKSLENFNHYENFHGCMINVIGHYGFEFFLSDISNNTNLDERKFAGAVFEIVQIMSEKFNFIPHYSLSTYIDSKLRTKSIKNYVPNDRYSFYLSIAPVNYSFPFSYYTQSISTVNFMFHISYNDLYTNYEKLSMPFDDLTWIFLFLTFGLTFATIFGLHFCPRWIRTIIFGKGINNPAYNALGIFFGISQLRLPRESFPRATLVTFIWFCLIIRTCWQSKMFEFMTTDMRKPLPASIEDLVKMNYTVVVEELKLTYYNELLNGREKPKRMFMNRSLFIDLYKQALDGETKSKYAFFSNDLDQRDWKINFGVWLTHRPIYIEPEDTRRVLSISDLEFGFVIFLGFMSLPIIVFICELHALYMPLNNGKLNSVSKPSWLKDTPSTTTTTTSTEKEKPTTRPWQRKTSATDTVKKEDSPGTAALIEKSETPTKITKIGAAIKKETTESPKKEVTAKLQSREIKVPLKVEKTIQPQSILKKPIVEKREEAKKPPIAATAVTNKPPVSKSQSTTPSKSPTPNKTPPSSKSTSKSPSKTPEPYLEEESSEEEEEEEETETETTESDSEEEEEEVDSDFDLSDDEPYRPPSPVNSKQKLVIPALKKVKKSPEPENEKREKSPEFSFRKPELKKVLTKQKSEVRERSPSPEEPKFFKAKLRKVPSSLKAKEFRTREKLPVVELKKVPTKQKIDMDTKKSSEQFPLKPSILRAESKVKIPAPPPPPPPPPPPGLQPPPDFEKKPLTSKKREYIEKLKSRPRRRPDWSEMMKEVESGRKLRHVQCNDRSSPIITCKSMTKVQGQYVFETEKKNTALDKLLTEIQSGVKLRPTKTNDRSKPILDGLRKFRRQMTIEEQILKSESKANFNTENIPSPLPDDIPDDYDDIDKVRDDLQSTKQMLALELRNKEAQERENKRLLARIANLEAELEREQARLSGSAYKSEPVVTNGTNDEVIINNLKKEVEESQKTAKLLEKKYHDVAEELDKAQKEIEEQKRLIAKLQGGDLDSRRQSEAQQKESSPEMELVLSEEEEDESEEKKAERAARRLKREVDMLRAKLTRLKEKENNARNERKALRDAMKKNQQILKDEKKKFKKLQKEVEKMAAMMKAVEEEGSDEEAEEKEEPEEEEEEEEESEQESEESESESDSDTESQSEDENAEDHKKKENLEPRVKRHDGRFSSLKKGNYLLEANVERLKDEIKDHKEKCSALQADLDSVIDLC
ncbi:hypothetical protein PVAND_001526 [Polypedilum vanderplanki]|uniref:WH2 domain-containing protein n=1 Tax=Polypedilum vanderplanki TaxID=319348 RepID=A0A9J6BPI5_POLVA|nr:hypothetical protein PVAND_001526 [Polypedilum vanderplanki]